MPRLRLDSRLRHAEALKLGKMVEVVAGHGFELDTQGEVAAFGMVGGPVEIRLAERTDQLQIPEAVGAEEFERLGQSVRGVVFRPGVLVERLQEGRLGRRGGKNLTQTEAVGEFAIRKMRDDLARAPLAKGDRGCDPFRRERGQRLLEQAGSRGEHGARVPSAEAGCIRIGHATQ